MKTEREGWRRMEARTTVHCARNAEIKESCLVSSSVALHHSDVFIYFARGVYVCRSKNNKWESVLSFHRVDPRD